MEAVRPNKFWVLFTCVNSTAVVVLGILAAFGGLDWELAALVFLVAAIFDASYADVSEDFKATLSVVVVFTAMAYGGVWLAVAAGIASGVVSGFTAGSDRFIKGTFNVSMGIIEAVAGAMAFAFVADVAFIAPDPTAAISEPVRLTTAFLASGLTVIVVNTALLTGILSSLRGVPFGSTLWSMLRSIVALQFVYVGLAAIAYTLLVKVGPTSLVLLLVPLAVARTSLRSIQQQQEAFDKMVRTFVKAIELKDGYTRGHAERVSDLSVMVAESMGLSYDERQLIRYGAILHDVGKIGVSLGILCKAGPLTDDEFAEMKLHPEIGAEMLADIDFLQPALAIVHHHHERIDGRGYPAGLAGEGIPLLTRVVTAVDAFDAMTSTRSYRRALPVSVALEELQANAGTQFDTEVVEHLVAVIGEHGWEITDEPVAVTPEPQQVSS